MWNMETLSKKATLGCILTLQIWISLVLAFARKPHLDIPHPLPAPLLSEPMKYAKEIFSNIQNAPPTDHTPAEIAVMGDPSVDKHIVLHVHTHRQTHKLKLQRLDYNILHKDFKVLTISTDSSGRTLFHEDTFPHVFIQKAKQSNFYHDPESGTLLNVKHVTNSTKGSLLHHVEGIFKDDIVIAPPVAKLRHRRATLHPTKHTVWTKQAETFNLMDDELFVPDYIDKLKMPPYFHQSAPPAPTAASPPAPTAAHPRARQRRQAGGEEGADTRIEPELLLFCDNALVQQFQGDTDELLEYLLHFWHAVNWKFLTISLQKKWPIVDLKIREIGVFRDANAQPFIEENRVRRGSRLFSLYDAMDSLQRWLVKYETVLPLHDIAFLQTGNDACRMTSHTRRFQDSRFQSDETEKEIDGCVAGTAGVAYVRGACLSAPYFRNLAYNFGIGEASTSFNGVIIAAHEVGHLLGAYHDGESEASKCSRTSGYLMSYSREDAFKFSRFSDCSIESFQNFQRMDRSGCLKQRGSTETMQFPTSFPGTYMNIHEQCRRFTGGPPCEVGAKQCEHLCCDDARGQWRYTRSEPAVDGTSCGKGNVCLNGQCVSLSTFG